MKNNHHVKTYQKTILLFLGLGCFICFLISCDNNQPVKSDKELFILFYSKLIEKTDKADHIFSPFSQTLQNGDFIGATQIALKIKDPINSVWGEISAIEPPNLQNQEAKKSLDKAKEAISGAYLYRSSMVRDFIDFAESQNMKKMAELKNSAENIQLLTLGGVAKLMETAEKLGVSTAELNTKK